MDEAQEQTMQGRMVITEPRAQRRLTVVLSFTIFFSVLNGIMFNIAAPDIAADLGLLPSEVSWVVTGYIVIFALGSATYGKLADLYSARALITTGLVLLCAGSIAGFFSGSYYVLILARVVQAAGGSAIPALAMLVATLYFPPGKKGRVLGVIASTVSLAVGLGPIVGGYISSALHWRFLFLVPLATVFAIPFFRSYLPLEDKPKGGFDTPGALLMGVGVACLLTAVTQGRLWFLIAGAFILYFFVWRTKRVPNAFLDPSLFSNKPYRGTVLTAFLSMGTIFGMMFMVPIMLREVNSLGAGAIGLVMFPGAMAAALVGRLGGGLSDRLGSRPVVYLGQGLLVLGYLICSTFAGSGAVAVALALITVYLGFSFVQSSFAHTVSDTLPPGQTGIGMGVYTLFFFMAGGFSAAVIGRVLDLKTAGVCINPLNQCAPAWLYSNIFVALAAVAAVSTLIFYLSFKAAPAPPSS